MKISCIIVHYHTPEYLKKAVSAIEKDASTSSLDIEIIVIDNGSTEKDRPILESLNTKLVKPGDNLGYAGGVNLGVKHSNADVFIFMNPDVEVLPGCIGALVKALQDGASAAGPRFYMDHGKKIYLPPLTWLSRMNEIIWRSSVLSKGLAKWVRNRWRNRAKAQWLATSPVQNYNLTGALLAITRRAWEQVGPFDEAFKLYFEEVDWLMRLKKSNLKACYVPESEAIHNERQSTSKEPKAKKWFKESAHIFRKRYYGTVFTAFLEHGVPTLRRYMGGMQENGIIHNSASCPAVDLSEYDKVNAYPLWIEVSVHRLGIPAFGIPVYSNDNAKWVFPEAVWKALEPGKYYLRLVDNFGREFDKLEIFQKS